MGATRFCENQCVTPFGRLAPLIASLEFTGERRKNLDREINYFLKGNKEGRFNYHKISSLKLPIGSGAVER